MGFRQESDVPPVVTLNEYSKTEDMRMAFGGKQIALNNLTIWFIHALAFAKFT